MPCLYRNMAKWRIVWLSLLSVVVCLVAFAVSGKTSLPPDAPSVSALQLACSEEAFDAILDQWGAQGIRYYQLSTLAIDYAFPVAYAVLFSSLIAPLGPRPGREPNTIGLACFVVPLIAGVLDWAENTLHLVVLSGAVSNRALWIVAASAAAYIKWGLLSLSCLLVSSGVVRRMGGRSNR